MDSELLLGLLRLETGANAARASNDVLKLATAAGAGTNAVTGRQMNSKAPNSAMLRPSFAIVTLRASLKQYALMRLTLLGRGRCEPLTIRKSI